MKRSEIAALLALAATLERSGWTPDEADVEAWHAMAEEGRWESFDAARRALLVYRSEQPDYPIRPGHITRVLQRVRDDASTTLNAADIDPPDSVLRLPEAEQMRAFRRWRRELAAAHHRQAIAAFVAGRSDVPRAIEAAT